VKIQNQTVRLSITESFFNNRPTVVGTPINWNVLRALVLPGTNSLKLWGNSLCWSHISRNASYSFPAMSSNWICTSQWMCLLQVCDYTRKVDSNLRNQLDSQYTEWFLATSSYKWNAGSESYMFDKYQSWQGAKEYTSNLDTPQICSGCILGRVSPGWGHSRI
jgi:hypothetical protein